MSRLIYTLTLLAVLLAAAVLPGCSGKSDEPVVTEPDGTVYHAGFYVTVGDQAPETSRTTPAGDYDEGSGLENHIDLTGGDVRVALLDTKGNYLGQITDFHITPVATYESSKRYYFNGVTDIDISSGSFKIMLLANWNTYPADNADFVKNAWEQTYDFKGAALAYDNLIPLYGIKDVAIPGGIEPGISANLGTIHLLRAMAKIEVILNDPTDKWHVKTLRLSHYHTTGYKSPYRALSESDYVTGSWETDYTSILNIPTGAPVANDLDFIPTSDGHWVVYVPEYSNSTASNPAARIVVSFDESFIEHETYIDFPMKGSSPMDIWRNYWYRFILNKHPETTDVTVEIDVTPYTVVDLYPEFGIPTE